MRSAADLLHNISVDLGLLSPQLRHIIATAPLRYKVFTIPKRDGSPREVAQPAREVKAIQRWLIADLKSFLPLHEAATAYRDGASIKSNAARHLDTKYLLKMDFSNFFPSITYEHLTRHLNDAIGDKYDESAVHLIVRACTWAPKRMTPLRLCIGAPSSPLLSNSVMFEFDRLIAHRAQSDGVIYTRYADDLTFSSNSRGALSDYPRLVESVARRLRYPSLVINTRKTVFASKAGRRSVTGVTLSSAGELSVGRDRKRLVRAMFHRATQGRLSPEDLDKLNGLIAFIEHIEPGFAKKLKSIK